MQYNSETMKGIRRLDKAPCVQLIFKVRLPGTLEIARTQNHLCTPAFQFFEIRRKVRGIEY